MGRIKSHTTVDLGSILTAKTQSLTCPIYNAGAHNSNQSMNHHRGVGVGGHLATISCPSDTFMWGNVGAEMLNLGRIQLRDCEFDPTLPFDFAGIILWGKTQFQLHGKIHPLGRDWVQSDQILRGYVAKTWTYSGTIRLRSSASSNYKRVCRNMMFNHSF